MSASVPVSPDRTLPPQPVHNLPARMVGVLRSPRATFAAIAQAPNWLGVLLATFLVTFLCNAALLQTEVGRLALVDQWERTAIAFGQPVDDARYAAFEEASSNGTLYAALGALSSGPLLTIGMAIVLYAIFRGALRGRATFTHVLAVTAYAGVILALRQVVAAPINYVRETLASPTTLSLVFRMLDEASPFARFFGVIDLFVIWWMLALAVGMSVLTGRAARPLALSFVGAYVGLAIVLTIIMAVTGGVA